jgi:multicomponent Na+:H+ antiporter subunit C
MTTALVPLLLIGVMTSSGVYLLLERNLTRMLLGLLLIGNAINLLILSVGGSSGHPPIYERASAGRGADADPLVQGMILTAIVITLGVAAFVLALAYRSYRLTTAEEVSDDPEDTRVSQQSEDEADDEVVHPEPALDADTPAALDAVPSHSAKSREDE